MNRALIVAVFVMVSSVRAAESGANCDLRYPPSESGEDFNHLVMFKIYPRVVNMDPGYTGCQIAWIDNGESWKIFQKVIIDNGDPIRVNTPGRASVFLGCEYRDGALTVGDVSRCPVPSSLLWLSRAPGCTEEYLSGDRDEGVRILLAPPCRVME